VSEGALRAETHLDERAVMNQQPTETARQEDGHTWTTVYACEAAGGASLYLSTHLLIIGLVKHSSKLCRVSKQVASP
jgi:hypothetical protein